MSEDEMVAVISAALYKWKWDREWPPATLAMKVYYEDKARFISKHLIEASGVHAEAQAKKVLEVLSDTLAWRVMTPDQAQHSAADDTTSPGQAAVLGSLLDLDD